jgi:hypothetical protein
MTQRPLTTEERQRLAPVFAKVGLEALAYADRPGRLVWPVEEFLRRQRCGQHVAARLRRLNPAGVVEGEYPRGWHRRVALARRFDDVMPVAEFVRRFGSAALRALPRQAFIREGRRRAITLLWLMETRFGAA